MLKKINHSIIDKLIFIILAILLIVVFIWDVLKDFIPDQYWQLKLLVIITGALSGFFTVLSFLWDKKFASMTEEISSVHNTQFEELSQKINTFLEEEFNSCDSFNDAIIPILNSVSEFNKVKIFAYSAKNYVECLTKSNVKIKHLQLCLRRSNDFSAWFVHNENRAKKYQVELEQVIYNLENLKEQKKILEYEVRFYDFEAYSHFGIFDDWILCGDLIPLFSEKKSVKIGKIQTSKNVGRNSDFFTNKETFFNQLFSCSIADSGLKVNIFGCHYCEISQMIQNPHHINGSLVKRGMCDISLINHEEVIEDFLLEPDFHPISELHMLLVCKFHILNIYDYLYHKNAIENLENLVYIIRNTIFKKTGQEIILFEHGSAISNSMLSGSSIEHLHLHIIYEPQNYDYLNAIINDNFNNGAPIFDGDMIRLNSIREFAQEYSIKAKDYFMIWKPGNCFQESEIYVWFPIKKESQYLRRIFFQGLSIEEKKSLYGTTADRIFDDEYNWKLHKFNYTDERLNFHKALGMAIQNSLEQTKKI